MSKTFGDEKAQRGRKRETVSFYIVWIIGISLRLSVLSPPISAPSPTTPESLHLMLNPHAGLI